MSAGSDSLGSYHTFDISQGVYYISGVRREFNKVSGYKTYITSPFYISFGEDGEVKPQYKDKSYKDFLWD